MRVLLLCMSCLLASVAAGDFEDLFKTDTTLLLTDESEWKVLFECLMERGPCGRYQDVKDKLLKLIGNKCEECTPEQKDLFYKTLKEFSNKYPKDYAMLNDKLLLSNVAQTTSSPS
uniref:Chemosensory protein 2 n=1 Tax=Grapholita molesta TaxID=192188 RepID=A0A0M4G4R3_GRAMO|nr:chemosensory protein 2 [Grapholita molesta]